MQHGAVRTVTEGTSLGWRAWRRMVRSPRWLTGTALGVAGATLHATALSLAPLVIVQPIGVLSLVVTVLLGRRARLLAVAAVCVGVTGVVLVAGNAAADTGTLNPLPVQPFVLVALLIAVVGRRRCLPLAVAAAIMFGTGSALIKVAASAVLAGHVGAGLWPAAESVVAIVVGGWVVHQAYAVGATTTVIAVTTVTDPFTAVVIGLWCYGEAPHLNLLAFIPFAALAAVGVAVVARSLPESKEDNPVLDSRILIAADTFPPDVNGASHFAARLAHGLAGRGYDVHVVCPSDTGRRSTSAGVVTVHRIPSLKTPFHPTFRYSTPWTAAREVGPLLDRLKPDVVHVQSHFSVGRSVLRAACERGLRVIATNHFMPENLLGFVRLPAPVGTALANWGWRDLVRVYRRATVVTSPTRRAVDLLTSKGFPGAPRAISCGVDLDRFASERIRRDADPTVLFVGRLDKEKNVHELLRALPLVPSLRAEIVGDGSCREDLERLAAQLGVADRARFHGLVSDADLINAYRRCDVFCMPGTAELQSIATMEAMAAGLAVVAADAMALPHLVRPGTTGFLFPPGDVAQLAAALLALAADPDLRLRMGRAGRDLVAAHSLERTLDAYTDLYGLRLFEPVAVAAERRDLGNLVG
ncbi:glycosyltransferase family 4 protein [Kibdelosporangium lantanae]